MKPFKPELPIYLLTDASRLHGIGFALMQKETKEDNTEDHRLITCGSFALSDCQKRYATVEIECLAIIRAIKKCQFYLLGQPTFTVKTDHQPLVGVFEKDIYDLDNPRL